MLVECLLDCAPWMDDRMFTWMRMICDICVVILVGMIYGYMISDSTVHDGFYLIHAFIAI